jgi:hypothetical protein
MGRGLSGLQRFILEKANTKKRVYYVEVLEGFYGWKPRRPIRRHGPNDQYGEEGEIIGPGAKRFSPQLIGEKKYRKVRAALSRACKRLADRGLVVRLEGAYSHWAGVEITSVGREWLSVNLKAHLPSG